ncbi:hypothetical protein HYO34_23145 [Vibrio parahaemolyticus]|nr:hypothetical protein [Vibrio parahaemolyticus]
MNEEEISKLATKLAEIGIEIPLDAYISAGVVTLITAGIGAYLGSYLKKKGENKEIKENFSNIKTQLEETTSISESIKDKIGKESHIYRYKFESYHAKQIEAIEGVYTHLVALEKRAQSFIAISNNTDGGNPTIEEAIKANFKAAKAATEDFIEYSSLKQMWMPEDLHSEIEELVLLMDEHVYKVLFKPADDKTQDFMVAVSTLQTLDVINNKVPQAKKSIINNVRQLLDPTHS